VWGSALGSGWGVSIGDCEVGGLPWDHLVWAAGATGASEPWMGIFLCGCEPWWAVYIACLAQGPGRPATLCPQQQQQQLLFWAQLSERIKH